MAVKLHKILLSASLLCAFCVTVVFSLVLLKYETSALFQIYPLLSFSVPL